MRWLYKPSTDREDVLGGLSGKKTVDVKQHNFSMVVWKCHL
jgi:hypothetical protein